VASRYRILRLIKRGGMAEVYEAVASGDRGFERKVALKRILPEAATEESFLERFSDEARLASRMHHANVVSVLDFGIMDGLPYQVLELVDGLDLFEASSRGRRASVPLGPALALHVAGEVAHGLAYAHAIRDERGKPLGVVHRDVSPGNVLLSWAGDVRLTDFGVAYALERLAITRVGEAHGKLGYMAPEQALSLQVDARTDLFALGCLLHWMAVGETPLEDEVARRELLAGAELPLSDALEPDLARIIARAVRAAPEDRYPDAATMAEECAEALARRSDRDPRGLLRAWLTSLRDDVRVVPKTPLEELMSFDVLVEEPPAQRRRFGSVALRQGTAISRPVAVARPTRRERVFDSPAADEVTELHADAASFDWLQPSPAQATVTAEPAFTPEPSGPSGAVAVPAFGADPNLGAVIHGYRILEKIGNGAIATVYRASHLFLGREYAVKLLRTATQSDRAAERLRREALALARLDHPNVVSVLDCGTTPDGTPFLTMELVRGRTLRAALKEDGPFEGPRAAAIVRQIAAALEAAHGQGTVHRDLKPSNVMLVDDRGRELVKVLDFGLARIADFEAARLTAPDALLGTPRFMAPEQIHAASEVGPSADLYALGALLYNMLSGQPPFLGKAYEVLEKQLRQDPPPLASTTGLEPLALRLLAKRPEDRLPNAAAVGRWLDERGFVADGQTILDPTPRVEAATTVALPGSALGLGEHARDDAGPARAPSPARAPALRPFTLGALLAAALALGWWLGARRPLAPEGAPRALEPSESPR
jgi:serine/threonine protein kinase